MGIALNDQGQLDEAIEAYQKAIVIRPDYSDAYNNMGNALKDQGNLGEAKRAYQKAIVIRPDYAEAHRNLSSISKYSEDDQQFTQVKALLNDEEITEHSRCNLSFTIAKMYEDMGELEQAFKYLSEGNALRKQLLDYSIETDKKFLRLLNSHSQVY